MNSFPLEFSKHLVFCIIGIAFFMFQFCRQGFKYQLMTAAAIGITLLLYINDSSVWRYTIGIVEAVLIVMIFIVMSAEKKKAARLAETKAAETENTNDETAAAEIAVSEEKTADTETAAVSDGEKENE